MKELAAYQEQHNEIRHLVISLRNVLSADQIGINANEHPAHGMLCDLARKVQEHLSGEDRNLYPELLIHRDPKVKTIAWSFIRGESPLRRAFEKYSKKWLRNCDFVFSEDFLADTDDILDSLMKRIDKEQKELFPLLEQTGLFQATGT
jgi:hemerythrin-like domain-containing protein